MEGAIIDLEPRTSNLEPQKRNPKFEVRGSRFEVRGGLEARNQRFFELQGRDSPLPVTPRTGKRFAMKLVAPIEEGKSFSEELETLLLSDRHLEYLERISRAMNPEMPRAFGWPHAIRAILDRIEESGIDLTDAASEEEIAVLAAGKLRRRKSPLTGPISASRTRTTTSRPADRPTSRLNLPETGRSRSGRRPRSGHG
jgi:hypothetical protein